MVDTDPEHIHPGRCPDNYRQYVRGFYGEAIDVTSLNRPDPSWCYVDRRGHTHQWYVNGEPAKDYRPSLRYELPTLTEVTDVPADDEHPGVSHYECTECRIVEGRG